VSTFTIQLSSSLFSKSPARLFQRRDKREERKEKVAFLPLVEKHFYYKIVCIFFGTSTQRKHPSVWMGVFFGYGCGLEEGGLATGKVKKCPVDTFLARGRVHG